MRIKILLILAFVLLLILGRNFTYGSNHIFTSSKENMSLSFIEQFKESFNFSIPVPNLKSEMLQTALTPRDATQLNGAIIPQTFPGILFMFGLVSFLLPFVLPFLTPLIFCGILYFYYRVIEHFFTKQTAFLATVFLLLLPTFTYLGTKLISDDLLSLLFILIGSFLLIKRKNLPLSAFILGLAVFIRLPNVIWILPLMIFSLTKIKDQSYFPSIKNFIWSAIAFLIPISSILLLNYLIYGGFLHTGYHIQYPILENTIGTETGVFKSNSYDFLFQTKQYLLFLYPISVLLGFVSLYKFHKEGARNILIIVYTMLSIFALLTFQYAGTIFWGYDSAALNSSFMRYVLPFYLLLPILSVYAFKDWQKSHQIFMVTVLSITFLATLFFFRGGLNEKWDQEEFGRKLQMRVLSQTNEETLVMTRFHDKFIFPKRKTLTVPLLRENIAYGYTDISPWLTPLDYTSIANSMVELNNAEKDFILLSDPSIDISRIQNGLSKNDLRLTPVFTLENVAAYRLSERA